MFVSYNYLPTGQNQLNQSATNKLEIKQMQRNKFLYRVDISPSPKPQFPLKQQIN